MAEEGLSTVPGEISVIFEQIFEMIDVGLVILDRQLTVQGWNRWMELRSGISADQINGTSIFEHYPGLENPKFLRGCKSVFKLGNFAFFSQKLHRYLFPFKPLSSYGMGFKHMQQNCTIGPIRDKDNNIERIFISVQDVTEIVSYELSLKVALKKSEQLARDLAKKHIQLEKAHNDLKSAQSQILQQEKMASIGQLAAGVAHEINNPMGFITSNLRTLDDYINKVTHFVNLQNELIKSLDSAELSARYEEMKEELDIDYVIEDLKDLVQESLEGAERVTNIVKALKSFSRVDEAEYKEADINECLESTLKIVWNELKYKATVNTDYGELPPIKCYPQQLNQVFMNLLINAGQSIEGHGEITVKTWAKDGYVFVSITDTGCGIPKEIQNRIFEPFFTTKEVGQGTGLGLSITYDIIKKHNGDITIRSKPGEGTTFTVKLPISGNGEQLPGKTPDLDQT